MPHSTIMNLIRNSNSFASHAFSSCGEHVPPILLLFAVVIDSIRPHHGGASWL